jgi:cytosine/adenosine deaminase-related metal-dependent hydrolase
MIDIRHRLTSDEMVAGALSFFENQDRGLTRFGLNPHAPYTASLLLYRLTQVCAQQNEMLLSTHVAESVEESDMFENAAGPLYSFLEGLGRPMEDCGHGTPFGWLWKNGAIGGDWLLAHLNDLKARDFELLEGLAPGSLPHVVHCPGSHAYFNHPRFPYTRLAKLGANICVGTDSLASTDSLSLFSELRRLQATEPSLTSHELLVTVTEAPARALKMQGKLGCLAPGAFADLIALPCNLPAAEAAGHCVSHTGPVSWMMVDGKVLDFAPL